MAFPQVFRRSGRAPLAACLLALSFLAAPARQQQQPSGAMSLPFTAVDESGRPYADLRKEDVRLIENGVPVEIAGLERRVNQPLSIILVLDMSVSQEKIIPVAKQLGQHLIDTLSQERDSVGVLSFTGESTVAQELTDNLEQARSAVAGLEFVPPKGYVRPSRRIIILPGGTPPPSSAALDPVLGTSAIWDAAWLASEKLSAQASPDARRLIILITDGYDTSSKRKLSEVIEGAIKARVAVHSIGVGEEFYGGTNKGDLRKLSERTGGRAFFPRQVDELREAFAALDQELGFQYVITYSPAAAKGGGDKLRKVKIEIANPELRKQKLRLAHPEGYYAK